VLALARTLAELPQRCLRSDRASAYESAGLELDEAMRRECEHGLATLESGESASGAARFASGSGRHGR